MEHAGVGFVCGSPVNLIKTESKLVRENCFFLAKSCLLVGLISFDCCVELSKQTRNKNHNKTLYHLNFCF